MESLLKIQICESHPQRFCFSVSFVGPEICGDLNYFSFLITQYVNTFLPCKILKHYLIRYDCIQLQAIKKKLTSRLNRWGLFFSRNKNSGSKRFRAGAAPPGPHAGQISVCLLAPMALACASVPVPARQPLPQQAESVKQEGRRREGQRALPFYC